MFKIAGATYFLIIFLPLTAIANCNLKCFRWECDIPTRAQPARTGSALVYCGNIPLYVSQAQFMKLLRYQRANVNKVLKINGEYIDSPCIPAHR